MAGIQFSAPIYIYIYSDLQPSMDIKHALGAHAYMQTNIHIK